MGYRYHGGTHKGSPKLLTDQGREVVKRIARERWSMMMLHSGCSTLRRLRASIVVASALFEIEPDRLRRWSLGNA
jgi:hypothetical protein